MRKLILLQGLLLQSLFLIGSEYESLENMISNQLEGNFLLGFTHSKFDQSLDILNYADKLSSTKPKEATTDTIYFSYQYKKLKLSYESFESNGIVERITQPKTLETDVHGDSIFLSYQIHDTDKNILELGLFLKEEEQDPVVIDCYAFGDTVIGGSCDEARFRVLDSNIYKTTGDLVYEPVLKTKGNSESEGIYLRISPKLLSLFNFTHTFTYKTSKVNQSFESAILNTTDSLIRGLTINGTNAGQLLDQFTDELPQLTPWEENIFKYSISNLYPFGERFAFSGMYSYINVQRNNYFKNPSKEDFSTNHLLDISLFYKLNKISLIYLKLSTSSNYLLGQNPLAYNRRSNHLFDHPYGQVNAGLVISF